MRQKFKAYKVQHLTEELLLMSFEVMSFKDRFGRAFPSTVTGHERGTPEKLFSSLLRTTAKTIGSAAFSGWCLIQVYCSRSFSPFFHSTIVRSVHCASGQLC